MNFIIEDSGHAAKTSIGYIVSRLLRRNGDVLHMRCSVRIIYRRGRGDAAPIRCGGASVRDGMQGVARHERMLAHERARRPQRIRITYRSTSRYIPVDAQRALHQGPLWLTQALPRDPAEGRSVLPA